MFASRYRLVAELLKLRAEEPSGAARVAGADREEERARS